MSDDINLRLALYGSTADTFLLLVEHEMDGAHLFAQDIIDGLDQKQSTGKTMLALAYALASMMYVCPIGSKERRDCLLALVEFAFSGICRANEK